MSTKVLVVDDELDTLNLLRTLLEITGFEPVTTLNSVEAITLAEIENVDVALLDIMMPDLDGFQLCRMLRQHDTLHQLPIIFVTAYDALDLEDRRKEVGADHVVRKPIDIDHLTTVIEEMYQKRQSGELPIPTIGDNSPTDTDKTETATQEDQKAPEKNAASNEKKTSPSPDKSADKQTEKQKEPETTAKESDSKEKAESTTASSNGTELSKTKDKTATKATTATPPSTPTPKKDDTVKDDSDKSADDSQANGKPHRPSIKPKRPPTPT